MTKIVQCPSCNTKFALNESQLAGVETPKFQCSRCQTIFNLTLDEEKLSKNISEIELPAKASPQVGLHNDNKSGVWDLGDATDKEPEEVDPFLQDFSIDLDKFSYGTERILSSAPITNEISEGTQLDFGFEQPKISHGPQSPSPTMTPFEERIAEASLRDSPTIVGSRLNTNTLDNFIYGESGQKDNPISVDWDADESGESNSTDYRKVREDLNKSSLDLKNSGDASDLSNIFRGGSQRSTTGTHQYQLPTQTDLESTAKDKDQITTTASSSPNNPSWSELKEKIERQDDDTDTSKSLVPIKQDPSDSKSKGVSSTDLMLFPFQDPAEDSDGGNRSMKHTTVIQRDELEVEGFLLPMDEHEEYPEILSPNKPPPTTNGIKSLAASFSAFLLYILSRPQHLAPFTRSLLLAWSVPVLFLLLLFIWGQKLNDKKNLNPTEIAFTEAVALFTPPELLLPPINLVINNLVAELRPDKTGEPMIVISGNIFNAGLLSVLNATVEARTFDKANVQIKDIQVPVPNELSRYASAINLTEISKEEIVTLQNKRSWDGIAPSKSIPFKVVVTDIGQGYKYFSAKIYSISELS